MDAWPGVMDGIPFHILCMKEPNYVMSLMTTYGTVELVGEEKPREWDSQGEKRRKMVKYPEVIRNHFQYRDAIDSNNGSRMYPIALEETWKTTRWENRVFQFLLAITEVNTKNELHHLYGHKNYSQIEFRKHRA